MAENTAPERARNGGKPWQPGQSGNPGGRPKGLAEVVALARAHTAASIGALARIMADTSAPPAAQVAAATALLDRAWGKPTQPIADDDSAPLRFVLLGVPEEADAGTWEEKYSGRAVTDDCCDPRNATPVQ